MAELDDYDGPQLDLDHFKILMEENVRLVATCSGSL